MARLLDPVAMVRTHALNRDERAQRAHDTVNKVIPEMLRTSPRARHGIHQSVLVLGAELENSQATMDRQPSRIRIRIKETDTFSAARQMTYSSRRASVTANTPKEQSSRRVPNVCVLNQASSIKPGGGFLDGVHSQEEFLCQRSTLFASLYDNFYPLPEVGGVFSKDVLVFGDSTPEAEELPKRDRIYVDAISASTIKFPGAARFKQADGDEVRRPPCSCGVSYCDQDREVVTAKMRAVLRIAESKGVEKLVLGAWGCGTYGNPSREVARLWKKAICGTLKSPATWSHIKDVVFAIPDRPALREFEKCFADIIASTASMPTPPPERIAPIVEEQRDRVQDLISEIQETETQLSQLLNPRTRGRLRDKLTTLNRRLAELGTEEPASDPDDDNVDDGFVVQDYPASDGEEGGSYYAFDENDDPSSSGSVTPASSYEFRFEPPSPDRARKAKGTVSPSPATEMGFVHATDDPDGVPTPTLLKAGPTFARDADERKKVDDSGGWFAGSVGELSALLRKTGPPVGLNPALSPVDCRGEGFPEF